MLSDNKQSHFKTTNTTTGHYDKIHVTDWDEQINQAAGVEKAVTGLNGGVFSRPIQIQN